MRGASKQDIASRMIRVIAGEDMAVDGSDGTGLYSVLAGHLPYHQLLLKPPILYYFVQFMCHRSHLISENPCNNFFSILADFGNLLEKFKVTCIYKLNEIVQVEPLCVEVCPMCRLQ
jgi:hypothetical protein